MKVTTQEQFSQQHCPDPSNIWCRRAYIGGDGHWLLAIVDDGGAGLTGKSLGM